MDIDIKELIKTAAESLSLKDFKGDIVAVKVVENQFGTIEEGGIGVQKVYNGTGVPATGDTAQSGQESVSPQEEDDGATAKAIPQDCVAAAGKIITQQFKAPNGTVLNPSAQIVKAGALIDLTSNTEVAMLMTICQELNAIGPGATCPDFVRALIGLGVIGYTDNNAIERMADGMTKKRNGYTKGSKTYPSLPAMHVRWKTSDRTIGDKIYNAMITQG